MLLHVPPSPYLFTYRFLPGSYDLHSTEEEAEVQRGWPQVLTWAAQVHSGAPGEGWLVLPLPADPAAAWAAQADVSPQLQQAPSRLPRPAQHGEEVLSCGSGGA